MKTTTKIVLGLSVVFTAVLAATRSEAVGERRIALAARPSVSGVHAIVYAQPFVLSRPWTHVWRVEQPSFDAGWLVVLDVDPTYVKPRQTYEPVLYAGDETVERINHGYEAGRVVAIVPCARDAKGLPALDLSRTPVWFGAEELPERVDAAAVRHERESAERRGVKPLPVPVVQPILRLESRDDIDQYAGILVLEHSPEEHDLGTGLLVPPTHR
jgi:hypothetical protein